MICGLIINFSAYGFVLENSLEGAGVESLMNGIGQARLGSSGALGSNPALLAWLPKKHQLTSTNYLMIFRLKTESNQSFNSSTDVIPAFAANSEGFGKWGHGYGLITSKMRGTFTEKNNQQLSYATNEVQNISINYGIGFKLTKITSFGLGLYLGQVKTDETFSFFGEIDDYDFTLLSQEKLKFWNQGISLGLAQKYDSWIFGISSKINTAKFGVTGTQVENSYNEINNSNSSLIENKKPEIKIIPKISGGIQKQMKEMNLFFDLSWNPGYSDTQTNESYKAIFSAGLALEGHFSDTYKWYSSFLHSPSNGVQDDNASISAGLSKKGQHSLNYGGVTWQRPYKKVDSEEILITFGTQFDY